MEQLIGNQPALALVAIVFVALYVAGVIMLEWRSRATGHAVYSHGVLGLAAALIATSAGIGLHSASINTVAAAARPAMTQTISPEALLRAIDVNALPVQTIDDPV